MLREIPMEPFEATWFGAHGQGTCLSTTLHAFGSTVFLNTKGNMESALGYTQTPVLSILNTTTRLIT